MELWNFILLVIDIILLLLTIIGFYYRISKFRKNHIDDKLQIPKISEADETIATLNISNIKRPIQRSKLSSASENRNHQVETLENKEKMLIPRLPTGLGTVNFEDSDIQKKNKTPEDISFKRLEIKKASQIDSLIDIHTKRMPLHEKDKYIDDHISEREKEMHQKSDWQLFKKYFELEATEYNLLCWICDSKSHKFLSILDHLLFISSLYELMILFSCLIIENIASYSLTDYKEIGYIALCMCILLLVIMFGISNAKRAHQRARKPKKYNHNNQEEEQIVNYISHSQTRFTMEVKVMLLFLLGFSAGLLGILNTLNLSSDDAQKVLIAIGVTFILDIFLVRNLIVFCFSLTRVCCCKKSFIKEKAEESVHVDFQHIQHLPLEEEILPTTARDLLSKRPIIEKTEDEESKIHDLRPLSALNNVDSEMSFQEQPKSSAKKKVDESIRLSPRNDQQKPPIVDKARKNRRANKKKISKQISDSTANSLELIDRIESMKARDKAEATPVTNRISKKNANRQAIIPEKDKSSDLSQENNSINEYLAKLNFAQGRAVSASTHTDEPGPKKRKIQDEKSDNEADAIKTRNQISPVKRNAQNKNSDPEIHKDRDDTFSSMELNLVKGKNSMRGEKINKNVFRLQSSDDIGNGFELNQYSPPYERGFSRETGDSWLYLNENFSAKKKTNKLKNIDSVDEDKDN